MTLPRRLGAAALAVVSGSGLLALGGVVATTAAVTTAAALTCADPAAAQTAIRVPVVVQVDDRAPTTTCVSIADGARGTEVLAARARALGTPPPRFDASGLLCAIDGFPETGCGERSGSTFRYWSYWVAGESGSWAYATVGPAQHRVHEGSVEGWRLGTGNGQAGDGQPTTTPVAAAQVCATVSEPKPTPTDPPAAQGTAQVPGTGPLVHDDGARPGPQPGAPGLAPSTTPASAVTENAPQPTNSTGSGPPESPSPGESAAPTSPRAAAGSGGAVPTENVASVTRDGGGAPGWTPAAIALLALVAIAILARRRSGGTRGHASGPDTGP